MVVEGETVEVLPDEVIVSERPREGESVVNERGETVALDLEVTEELRRAGLARGVFRLVQEARKSSGFDVSDRISLVWQAGGELADAIAEHAESVAGEVLATSMSAGEPSGGLRRHRARPAVQRRARLKRHGPVPRLRTLGRHDARQRPRPGPGAVVQVRAGPCGSVQVVSARGVLLRRSLGLLAVARGGGSLPPSSDWSCCSK